MTVQFVAAYWPGLIGAAAGLIAGLVVVRRWDRQSRLSAWDSMVTLPVLLAAGTAHLFLIPAVELQREVLFGLYGAALFGVTLFALLGLKIWRLGAVLFPLGSIAAYAYFATMVHQADYIGLLVKLVELAAVASALVPVVSRGRSGVLTAAS